LLLPPAIVHLMRTYCWHLIDDTHNRV
jgi:hypothetical protein